MGWFADSLSSIALGLGRFFGRNPFAAGSRSQAENEFTYRNSWLGRKVHDIVPYDMTREWRAWQTDKDSIEKLEAEERRLKLRAKVRRALLLGRLHGGGALILGLPGNPNQEVKPESVGLGGLGYVHVVSRFQCQVTELVTDVTDPRYGEPKMFTIGGVDVHPSRVIAFVGQPLPEGMIGAAADTFWGDPLLQSLATSIENSDEAQASIKALLDDAKVDVVTIPDLMGLVASEEYEQRLMKRLQIAAAIRDTTKTLLISGPAREGDPGEKWETRELNFANLDNLGKLFLAVASGAADIPATRLLGQSPDGMNATGESDLRNYYDMIGSRQETDLTPAMDPLDDFFIRSALGKAPTDIHYEWSPLWQLTPEQTAEVMAKKATAIKTISDTGLVPTRALEEGVQNMLIEDGVLPGLEAALEALPKEERWPSESAPSEEEMLRLQAELRQPPAPAAGARPSTGNRDPNAPPQRRAANDRLTVDASPRTLYVHRQVMNADAIREHFKAQGFEVMQPEEAMHVTVAHSSAPVDWMTIAADWAREPNGNLKLPAGGPRIVERLGEKRAVVLFFSSWELSHRHGEIIRAGATWDFGTYQPHITLTYNLPDDFDLDTLKPWIGEIDLGPEIFEEVKDGWVGTVIEDAAAE